MITYQIGTKGNPTGLLPVEESNNAVPVPHRQVRTFKRQHLHASHSQGCNCVHIFRICNHDTRTQSHNVTCLKIQFEKHSFEEILLGAQRTLLSSHRDDRVISLAQHVDELFLQSRCPPCSRFVTRYPPDLSYCLLCRSNSRIAILMARRVSPLHGSRVLFNPV